MRIRPVGEAALLLDLGDDPELIDAWRAELTHHRAAGELTIEEIVPAARTILLDGVSDPASLATRLPGWAPRPSASSAEGLLVEIPTWYGGEDLDAVAVAWHMTRDEVVARHTGTTFRVAFCGFSPGFAYLTGLPPELAVPRLDTPRTRVPAGSVGLADRYCGIYPTASPGGWRLIGRTGVRLFDPDRDPPALLTPGTRVRFVEVDE
jgi:KipI family sensor histidine kinase inhibitor